MNVTVSQLGSTEMERESKKRVEAAVHTAGDVTSTPPYFAFTEWTERPTTWVAGTWSDDGRVALSPMVGQRVPLDVGIWQVWLKVNVGGETHVEHVGRLRVR